MQIQKNMTDGRQSSQLHHLLSEEKVAFFRVKGGRSDCYKSRPVFVPTCKCPENCVSESCNFHLNKCIRELQWEKILFHKSSFKNTAHKFSLRKIQMYCFPLLMRSKLRQNSDHSKPRTHIPLFVLSYFTKATVAKIQLLEFKLCFVIKCIL